MLFKKRPISESEVHIGKISLRPRNATIEIFFVLTMTNASELCNQTLLNPPGANMVKLECFSD